VAQPSRAGGGGGAGVRRALVVACLLAGCSHGAVVGTPRSVPARQAVDPGTMRVAVLRALSADGWSVAEEGPGEVVGQLQSARYSIRVRIRYDGARFAVGYESSEGLDARTDASGRTRVDNRYFRHVERLERGIGGQLALLPPGAGIPVPTTYGAPAVTAQGPPQPAAVPPAPGTAPAVAAVAPPPPAPAREPVSRRPFWELAAPGISLFAGAWIANWTGALALGGQDQYLGLSFLPIAGPWAQLPQLEWALYPRWTGIYHPTMGLLQAAGLVMMIVGLVVQVEDDDASAEGPALLHFALTPAAGGAELSVGGRF